MKHIKKVKLSTFLDNEVSPEERTRIVEHLKICTFCQREVEEQREVSDFLGFVEDVEVSPYFFVRIKRRIAHEKSKLIIRSPFIKWVRRHHLERIAIPVQIVVFLFFSCLGGNYLGRKIYTARMEITSGVSEEFTDVFNIQFFDNNIEGSLSSAYDDLLIREENE